jgi:hypothetical protein
MAAALGGLLLMAFPSLAQITTLEGIVTGMDGNPVQGAVIQISPVDVKTQKPYTVKTDKKGHYIYNLVIGTYDVSCQVDGKEVDHTNGVKTSPTANKIASFDLKAAAAQAANLQAGNLSKKQDRSISAEENKQAEAFYQDGLTLMAKAFEMGGKILPVPGTAEAFQKYLELAPDGPHAQEAKAMLSTLGTTLFAQTNPPSTRSGIAQPASSQSGPNGVSYKVALVANTDSVSRIRWVDGTLSVRGFTISYSDSENSAENFSIPCSGIQRIEQPTYWGMRDWLVTPRGTLKSREKGLNRSALYQGIKDACNAQEASHLEEAAQEEEARARKDAARRVEAAAAEQEAAYETQG